MFTPEVKSKIDSIVGCETVYDHYRLLCKVNDEEYDHAHPYEYFKFDDATSHHITHCRPKLPKNRCYPDDALIRRYLLKKSLLGELSSVEFQVKADCDREYHLQMENMFKRMHGAEMWNIQLKTRVKRLERKMLEDGREMRSHIMRLIDAVQQNMG
jgi:hypothetical protein